MKQDMFSRLFLEVYKTQEGHMNSALAKAIFYEIR